MEMPEVRDAFVGALHKIVSDILEVERGPIMDSSAPPWPGPSGKP